MHRVDVEVTSSAGDATGVRIATAAARIAEIDAARIVASSTGGSAYSLDAVAGTIRVARSVLTTPTVGDICGYRNADDEYNGFSPGVCP